MARLFHVRDKELQSSTFTANPTVTQESGEALLQEDGGTLEWDGAVSWQVHIRHVPPKKSLFHTGTIENFNATVAEEVVLVTEDATELVDENGGTFLAELGQTWPTPLIHV